MPELIVIGGPTASGKTRAAIALAQHLQCPILSADSRQFFKEMNIGTAKPSAYELSQAQHYFIDNKSISEDYSAGDFELEGLELLSKLFNKHKYIILVGGSGLYIDALCQGLDNLPKSSDVRNELNEVYTLHGLSALQVMLRELDSNYYEKCDNQNPIRLIRAIEIIKLSGRKMAEVQANNKLERNFNVRYFIMNWEREALYERIEQRVDLMISQGLLKEVHSLLPYRHKNALQTVGYKELFEYIDGTISFDRAIELIKQNSRRYAKRQITWFKRYTHATWIHPMEFENSLPILFVK